MGFDPKAIKSCINIKLILTMQVTQGLAQPRFVFRFVTKVYTEELDAWLLAKTTNSPIDILIINSGK